VARQFESKGVSVVTQENQGVCAVRNKVYELCQGDYIQWLDADDLLSPDKIAKQMEVAEQTSKPSVFPARMAVSSQGRPTFPSQCLLQTRLASKNVTLPSDTSGVNWSNSISVCAG